MKLQGTKQIKRESTLVKVGAGCPAGSLEMEGSRFPNVLRWGSGSTGAGRGCAGMGRGSRIKAFP